jgi:hypothetical protein
VRRGNVGRDEARVWLVKFLLRRVRADTYPSTDYLDLIEKVIPCYMLDEYIDVLIDKVDDDCYPSIDLLRRITHVIECLPRRNFDSDQKAAAEETEAETARA